MCPVKMVRLSETRGLTAIAVFAFLVVGSPAAVAQNPILNPNPIPAPLLAETSQAPPSSVAPVFQIDPEDVGDALMLHQRYQAAREAYSKADPTSRVWNKLGIANEMMFNFEDASRCFKEALKLDRKNANALNNLGTIYASTKQFTSAERMYRRALVVEPGSALIHKNLGTDLLAQHKYKEGWESYQAALLLDRHIFEDVLSLRVGNPIDGPVKTAWPSITCAGPSMKASPIPGRSSPTASSPAFAVSLPSSNFLLNRASLSASGGAITGRTILHPAVPDLGAKTDHFQPFCPTT